MSHDLIANVVIKIAVPVWAKDSWWEILPTPSMLGSPSHYVNLAWDISRDPNLAGYKLYQGIESKKYDVNVVTIWCKAGDLECECRLGPISEGTYYWAITAFNSSGHESEYSEEIVHTF
jgi:hypothetical protein